MLSLLKQRISMKILLNDNSSIIEYLYRRTLGEDVELTSELSEADAIVATTNLPSFYGKTLIVTSEKVPSSEDVLKLAQVNDIETRVPLDYITNKDIAMVINPYKDVKIKDLKFNACRTKPLSILAIKDYLITKYKNTYYIDKPTVFLGSKYKGFTTLIGLLKRQIED